MFVSMNLCMYLCILVYMHVWFITFTDNTDDDYDIEKDNNEANNYQDNDYHQHHYHHHHYHISNANNKTSPSSSNTRTATKSIAIMSTEIAIITCTTLPIMTQTIAMNSIRNKCNYCLHFVRGIFVNQWTVRLFYYWQCVDPT